MIANKLIAHRGGALLAPENTLGAMTLAREIDANPWNRPGGRDERAK